MKVMCNLQHLWGGPHTIGKSTVMIGADGSTDVDDKTGAFLLTHMPKEWSKPGEAAAAAAAVPARAIEGTAFDGPGAPKVVEAPRPAYVPRDMLGRERDPNVPVAVAEARAAEQGAQPPAGSPPPPPPPPNPAPPSASPVPTPPGHSPSGSASEPGPSAPHAPQAPAAPSAPAAPQAPTASGGEGLRAALDKMPEPQLRKQAAESGLTIPEGADKAALVDILASAAEQQARS